MKPGTSSTGNKGNETTPSDSQAPLVREKSQSVLVIVDPADLNKWIKVCSERYGEPKDQGSQHGIKLSSIFQLTGTEQYGTIHITIYNTNKILVQGNSYILWLEEHYPELKKLIQPQRLQSSPKAIQTEVSEDNEPGKCCMSASCSAENNESMIECNNCKNWYHYQCTGLSTQTLKPLIEVTDE